MSTPKNHTVEPLSSATTSEASVASRPFTTISGRPVASQYTPGSLEGIDPDIDIGLPGQFPYTRGIHASGYRGKLWTMRQFAGYGTPEETTRRDKELLAAGGT